MTEPVALPASENVAAESPLTLIVPVAEDVIPSVAELAAESDTAPVPLPVRESVALDVPTAPEPPVADPVSGHC